MGRPDFAHTQHRKVKGSEPLAKRQLRTTWWTLPPTPNLSRNYAQSPSFESTCAKPRVRCRSYVVLRCFGQPSRNGTQRKAKQTRPDPPLCWVCNSTRRNKKAANVWFSQFKTVLFPFNLYSKYNPIPCNTPHETRMP